MPDRITRWPDLLLTYVGNNAQIFAVPGLNNSFGIGMNHPDLGTWNASTAGAAAAPKTKVREDDIQKPSATIVFADSAHTTNTTPAQMDPDGWRARDPKIGVWLFRTPANSCCYDTDPWRERVVNRYNGRAAAMIVDGHAEFMKASEMGFQDRTNSCQNIPSGDSRAMWDTF